MSTSKTKPFDDLMKKRLSKEEIEEIEKEVKEEYSMNQPKYKVQIMFADRTITALLDESVLESLKTTIENDSFKNKLLTLKDHYINLNLVQAFSWEKADE